MGQPDIHRLLMFPLSLQPILPGTRRAFFISDDRILSGYLTLKTTLIPHKIRISRAIKDL